ncbi:MAG: iron-sulfur cluster carrier protein ApbC [Steroidobacteraceae bacterium]|jgi:ATP-binding protein involved in chromosome partitioning|nr:iron-sulfur cluster carrier protein ApbC [Steroidobacteraceae bacterium]
MNEAALRSAAAAAVDPALGAPLGEAVRGVAVEGTTATVYVVLGFPVVGHERALEPVLLEALRTAGWSGEVRARLRAEIVPQAVQGKLKPLPTIKNVIAVASGKGGVGKSTTSANLALALAAQGAKVGLLDADIYGPSQPLMMGLEGRQPTTPDGKSIEPLANYGVEVMSIGFLIDAEQPMVWRGPMVTQALTQLLGETRWGDLDYLVVDMPPGTGDTQLTLAQRVPVAGAIVVTTPQDIALLDARKGLQMFRKVEVPVLGIVENMATHVCSNCGHEEPVFGAGGGERMAAQYGVPLLGSLPLDIRIREQADGGRPTVVAEPEGRLAQAYHAIARRAAARLSTGLASTAFPTLSVSDD